VTELTFNGSSRERLAGTCQTFGLETITKIAKLKGMTFADHYLLCLLLSQEEAPGVESEHSVEGGVRHGLEVGGVQQARRLLESKEY
jgi:hypothetical protein